MIKIFCVIIALGFTLACQQKPTKALSTEPLFLTSKAEKSVTEVVKLNPVFVDTRSAFDFGISHVPGSVNIRWQDFYVKSINGKYILNQDSYSVARRLATLGISPERPVAVLYNEQTLQEAYHLAWLLVRWGVKQVHAVELNSLRALNVKSSSPPRNAEMWLPNINKYMYISSELARSLLGQGKLRNIEASDWRGVSLQVAFNRYCLIKIGRSEVEGNVKRFTRVVQIDESLSFSDKTAHIKKTLSQEEVGCLIMGGGDSIKEALSFILSRDLDKDFIPVYGD